jgi:hypothetical protein
MTILHIPLTYYKDIINIIAITIQITISYDKRAEMRHFTPHPVTTFLLILLCTQCLLYYKVSNLCVFGLKIRPLFAKNKLCHSANGLEP